MRFKPLTVKNTIGVILQEAFVELIIYCHVHHCGYYLRTSLYVETVSNDLPVLR